MATLITRIAALGDVIYAEPVVRAARQMCSGPIIFASSYPAVFENHPCINFVTNKSIKSRPYLFSLDLNWVYERFWYEGEYGYIPELYIKHFSFLRFPDPIRPQIFLTETEKSWISLLGKKVLLIHPFSSGARLDNIADWQVIINVARAMGFFTIGVGQGHLDVDLDLDLFNKTNLRQLFSAVYRADVVLCTESGVLAIADAMDKRGVALIYRSCASSILHPKSRMHPIACHNMPMKFLDLKETKPAVWLKVEEIVFQLEKLKQPSVI